MMSGEPTASDAKLERRLKASGYDLPGFAERYDAYRPRPPAALRELVLPLVGGTRPRLVVDLGSGTGLSTRFWADVADEVVGVEPNAAMCTWAEANTEAPNIRYVQAPAERTGLADASADLITAAQSLQWMDPGPTFAEAGRILRPGGVFCAYEYFSLQTPLWEPEAAWVKVRENVARLRAELDLDRDLRLWKPATDRLEESGVFRFVRELAVHSLDQGDGDRLIGFALSEGSLQTLLATGVSEQEVGLDELRRAAARMTTPVSWWIGYRVWLGLATTERAG